MGVLCFHQESYPREVEIIRRIPGELATGYQETANIGHPLVLDLLSGSVMSDSLQPLGMSFSDITAKVE